MSRFNIVFLALVSHFFVGSDAAFAQDQKNEQQPDQRQEEEASASETQSTQPELLRQELLPGDCPHELAFINAGVYYYSVIDCGEGNIKNYYVGYEVPVETGCNESPPPDCNTTEPHVATIPATTQEFRVASSKLGKIPVDDLEQAEKVYVNPDDLARLNFHYVKDPRTQRYFLAIELEIWGPNDEKVTAAFARELSGQPERRLERGTVRGSKLILNASTEPVFQILE